MHAAEDPQSGKPKDLAEKIKEVGGLVAVVVGVVAVAAIAGGALLADGDNGSAILGAAAAAIGSIVGAYFGVKVGTDQTKNTAKKLQEESKKTQEESSKAQVFAAHLPKEDAKVVVDQVMNVAKAFGGGK
jgi:predicted ATP-grasp superfamily ATP-dependent carboligase